MSTFDELIELSKEVIRFETESSQKAIDSCVKLLRAEVANQAFKSPYTRTMDDKDGFLNRHKNPLPKEKTILSIFFPKAYGEPREVACIWKPFDKRNYQEFNMPSEGYLGTAIDALSEIGFHAWEQTDSEFVYYRIIATKTN